MKIKPIVSIIIPFHWKYNSPEYKRFVKDLDAFYAQTYAHVELLIVTDQTERLSIRRRKNVRILVYPGHTTSPAIKRDYALRFVRGEICGFIDDDAYPRNDWVEKSVSIFKNEKVIAVGGPGLTPKEDGYWEQLSGLVYESFFCSGAAQYRFVSLPPRYVYDYPAYNFFVLTDVLKKVGGFGNSFYGGEDTFLCLKLINEGNIFYDGDVVVYHHRRPLFIGLLKQIGNVGLHRGYFAVKYPKTSRRWFYFLPSILSLGLLIGAISLLYWHQFIWIYIGIFFFVISLGALSVIEYTNITNAFIVGLGIVCVHVWYGTNFILGLLSKDLDH